jgi:1-acyl-sn-glycerol-3-phosphate acyltransferase
MFPGKYPESEPEPQLVNSLIDFRVKGYSPSMFSSDFDFNFPGLLPIISKGTEGAVKKSTLIYFPMIDQPGSIEDQYHFFQRGFPDGLLKYLLQTDPDRKAEVAKLRGKDSK